MDPGKDQQVFNRLRREAIRRWARRSIEDLREIKRRMNKVKTKPDGKKVGSCGLKPTGLTKKDCRADC